MCRRLWLEHRGREQRRIDPSIDRVEEVCRDDEDSSVPEQLRSGREWATARGCSVLGNLVSDGGGDGKEGDEDTGLQDPVPQIRIGLGEPEDGMALEGVGAPVVGGG